MCAQIEHVQIIRYYEISIIKVEIYVSSRCRHSFIGEESVVYREICILILIYSENCENSDQSPHPSFF